MIWGRLRLMTEPSTPWTPLSDLSPGDEADFFALLVAKEPLTTRDGKPYHRVAFRDAGREVSFPIWADSPWHAACSEQWTPGCCYKLRAQYRETNYGPQLDIRKIREAGPDDADDGYDPAMFLPQSRWEPQAMFDELRAIADSAIQAEPLRQLVVKLLDDHADALLRLPAAQRNHHAHAGGYLEHVLNVTRTAVYLAEQYPKYYPELQPPLDADLVVAGAILHDVGKLRELRQGHAGAEYSPEGDLIGHVVLGRDMVREAAIGLDLPPEQLLRLEHVILAHQRLPEWGAPKPPMTPEALLVHYADDLDAKYQMMVQILTSDASPGHVTSNKNVLRQKLFRGLETE